MYPAASAAAVAGVAAAATAVPATLLQSLLALVASPPSREEPTSGRAVPLRRSTGESGCLAKQAGADIPVHSQRTNLE